MIQQLLCRFFLSPVFACSLLLSLTLGQTLEAQEVSFMGYQLTGESSNNPTSLQFGPDGRLYVAQQDATIYVYTIERVVDNDGNVSYNVLATETISIVKNQTPNHNDDGSVNSTQARQMTGLLVAGTAENVVLYVTSSDSRISVGNDSGLDTNSGIISQLTWNGSEWEKIDLVRGLPRCEENHAINGLDLDPNTNKLYVQMGGNTNKGAPGNNFSGTPEYFFAGALLRVDLNQLDAMPVYTDLRTNTAFKYDLPTLNDPTRTNIDNTSPDFPYAPGHPMYNASIDPGDPFGGNNGLNQAIPEAGGPVEIFVPGFRNAYDVVLTDDGRIYTSDNGPNGGWGGMPLIYTADGTLKGNQSNSVAYEPENGDYITNEFNENGSKGHGDPLHFVGTTSDLPGTYYGGHPVPIRAFPERSQIIVYEEIAGNWQETSRYNLSELLGDVSGYYKSSFTIDPDFPDDPDQGLYSATEVAGVLDIINSSTNGIDEYTASNFSGAMQGNLLTASYGGAINRYVLNAAGDGTTLIDNNFLSGFGNQPLDVIAQGDDDPFPGTIWAATYGADNIMVFEPADFGECLEPGDDGYVGTEDYDGDGFSNDDEILNGTNHCSAGSKPEDNDGDFISDLLDDDDDNDGILDVNDAFALDADNGTTTDLPVIYPFWNNDPGTGFFGLGFTGLMTNGATDYLDQFDPSIMAPGGAAGNMLIEAVPPGDAYQANNNQEYGFQYGVNVDVNSPSFTVHSKLLEPFFWVDGAPTAPENFQSFGIFIGAGDQDNYLKVVFTANGGSGGVQVLLEDNGATTAQTYNVGDILNAGEVDLYIGVDPAANTAQPFASIDGGETIAPLGSPINLPASWLSDADAQGLAVGIISTSFGPGDPFGATWDFLNVTNDATDELLALVEELDFGVLTVNTSPSTLNLPVRNSGGPGDAIIEVTGVTISGPGAGSFAADVTAFSLAPGEVAENEIDITFTPGGIPGTFNAVAEIIHDGGNSPLLVPLTAEVADIGPEILRVNAGGAAIVNPADGGPDWLENETVGGAGATDPSFPSYGYTVNVGNVSGYTMPLSGRHSSIPVELTDQEYLAIFESERWDPPASPEMLWTFTVPNGDYEVRLYMANGFGGTSESGERIFDVLINGVLVIDDKDLSGEYGHKVGVMESYTTTATNGTIEIEFIHQTENPLINAIEIIRVPDTPPSEDIVVTPISDRLSEEGDVINLQVQAEGGDGALNYEAAGLPAGLDIDPLTGEITGTVAEGAAASSPYSVSITVDDDDAETSDAVTETFVWTVIEPNFFPPGTVLYRVNVGGPQTDAADATDPAWSVDNASNPSAFRVSGSNNIYSGNAGSAHPGPIVMTDPSLPPSVPAAVFLTERFDQAALPEMKWEFPIATTDPIEVRLYFAELFSGITEAGQRVFDVTVEGNVPASFDNIDPYAVAGPKGAFMRSFTTSVTDGTLDLEFIHVVENPALKGIEIIAAGDPASPAIAGAELITQVIDPIGNGVDVTIATTGISLPNGVLDPATVNTSTVKLFNDFTDQEVASTSANVVTGAENVVLTVQNLAFGTTYRLEVGSGVEDVSGAPLIPFTSFTFTTDAGGGAADLTNVVFEQVAAVNRSENYTTVTVGPDGKLYALTADGLILRWTIGSDGLLTDEEEINSLQTAEGGDRLALGLTFDPLATANDLIAWVTHSDPAFSGAAPWTGKLTQLSGATLQNVQDYLVGLPRAAISHATNSIVFDDGGKMYLSQGHTSAVGEPGTISYGAQPEQALSAAILEIDVSAIANPPLNVQTADGVAYDPTAADAPVTVFASGTRNAFDLVWHSNGNLYAPTNGAEAGQLVPGIPGFPAFSLSSEPVDYLNRIEAGGYYGHPNPGRNELVLNGGNPTAGPDPGEVEEYPVGTLPDPNWRGYAYQFGGSESPNGIIEYKSGLFDGALQGSLLITRYNQGFDIVALTPGGTFQNIVAQGDQLPGSSGLISALDLTEDPNTGNIYVSIYGGPITLLRAVSDNETADLTIEVELQGRSDYSGQYEVDLFLPSDENTPVYSFTPTAESDGVMNISGIEPGTYDIYVKRAQYLSRVKTDEVLSAGANSVQFTGTTDWLLAGDANDDNLASAVDFSILVQTFNKSEGEEGYDGRPDFNGDGVVSALDYSLFVLNFNVGGETPANALQTVEIRQEAPTPNSGDLLLEWERERTQPGTMITAQLLLASGAQPVDAVQTILGFDPEVLELVEIQWNDAFDITLREDYDNTEGRIRLAAGSLEGFPSGTRAVATLHFLAKTAGNGLLYFARAEGKVMTEVTFGGQLINGTLHNGRLMIGDTGSELFEITAYPNPAGELITLEVNTPADAVNTEVRLINAAGITIWNRRYEGAIKEEIDLSGLPAGSYILHVRNGSENRFQRIVHQ